MTVGLPGTGIGGLYYFLLVLFMPLREAWLTLCGRGSTERWKQVGMYWCFLIAMLGVLWGESWLLQHSIAWLQEKQILTSAIGDGAAGQSMMLSVGQLAAIGSVLTLTALILFASMLHGAMKLGWIKSTPPHSASHA